MLLLVPHLDILPMWHLNQVTLRMPQAPVSPASVLSLEPCTPGCSRTTWGPGHRLPQKPFWSLESGWRSVEFTVQSGSQLLLERHQSRMSPESPRLMALVHQGPGPPSSSPSLPPFLPPSLPHPLLCSVWTRKQRGGGKALERAASSLSKPDTC